MMAVVLGSIGVENRVIIIVNVKIIVLNFWGLKNEVMFGMERFGC